MDTQAKNTTSTASTTTEGAAAKPAQAAVTLESPIQRGATHIELLHLRRPWPAPCAASTWPSC
ncbi:hypothetical protein ACHFCA_21905 [Delftia tsuruhatensis]